MLVYDSPKYGKGQFHFDTSGMGRFRAQTLFIKEPWTIEWLLELKEDDVLWDVGANLGIYSLWAAHKTQCKTIYAFEPSYLNYPTLCQNIIDNQYHQIDAFCLALLNDKKVGRLTIPSQEVGSSGVQIGSEGIQSMITLTPDELIDMGLKPPTFVKIDVDGLDHVIARSFENALITSVKTILIELDQRQPEHAAVIHWLRQLGFNYDKKLLQQNYDLRKDQEYFRSFAEFIFWRL